MQPHLPMQGHCIFWVNRSRSGGASAGKVTDASLATCLSPGTIAPHLMHNACHTSLPVGKICIYNDSTRRVPVRPHHVLFLSFLVRSNHYSCNADHRLRALESLSRKQYSCHHTALASLQSAKIFFGYLTLSVHEAFQDEFQITFVSCQVWT